MPDTVVINEVTVPTNRLASFTFALHSPDSADGEQAALWIESSTGDVIRVSGPEAVTLKVLLSSIGIRERAALGEVVNDCPAESAYPLQAGAPAGAKPTPQS